MIHLTTLAIFVELFLGADYLVSLANLPSIGNLYTVHEVWGGIVAILALVTLIVVWHSKPRYKMLDYHVTLVFIFIIVAAAFASPSTTLIHVTLAIIAFGVAVATSVIDALGKK